MAELRSLFNRARDFSRALNQRGLVTYSASCAFYTFLSLFPLAALLASLVPCLGVHEEALLHWLDSIAPGAVSALLKVVLANVYTYVFPALPISVLILLWSAAQAFSELLKGMTAMTCARRHAGFFRRRIQAVFLTLALLATLLLSLGVLVFGARIVLLLGLLYPQLWVAWRLILWLRYLVMALLLFLLFVFLYRSIPGQGFSFRDVQCGAALSSAAWIVFSALFSLYASRILNVSLYGSMAALALTMLWLFYCQYIVLVGAGICAHIRDKKKAVPKETAS